MDIVVAMEGMWVLCFVINALNLDSCVVEFKLAATHISHLCQSLQWLVRLDVYRHGDFALCNGPHMQVMHVDYIIFTNFIDSFAEFLDLELARSTLHHNLNASLDNGNRSDNDNDREEVCADGISPPKVFIKVDAACCDDHTD